MKKFFALMLVASLAASAFAACGNGGGSPSAASEGSDVESALVSASSDIPEVSGSGADAAAEAAADNADGFTLYYPSYMQESEGETLVLEEEPERIVALSNAAMQILVRCGVQPVAVTEPTSFVEYPDWVSDLPVISTGMSTLDIESVVSMEPDLVIMGSHLKEDYGAQLDAAGIPVYYTSEGPSITYTEVKEEAEVLTRSFGTEEQAEEVAAEFAAVEERAAAFQASMDPIPMMILFAAPPSYQQTSQGYLGSILSMLPFENLSDGLIGADSRTAPLDLEKLVELDPEVLFAISPTSPSAEVLQASYEEEFANNPDTWGNLQAVANDDLIYLSSEYVTSKGIHIIDSINSLIDMLEEKFAE